MNRFDILKGKSPPPLEKPKPYPGLEMWIIIDEEKFQGYVITLSLEKGPGKVKKVKATLIINFPEENYLRMLRGLNTIAGREIFFFTRSRLGSAYPDQPQKMYVEEFGLNNTTVELSGIIL